MSQMVQIAKPAKPVFGPKDAEGHQAVALHKIFVSHVDSLPIAPTLQILR